MAKTPSTMLPLGTRATDFSLYDPLSNSHKQLEQLIGDKATVICFICNHCPYVLMINDVLVKVATHYQQQGINFIAISSNDEKNYPQDGPEKMAEHAINVAYPFPYLYDESQSIAKAYQAACTPDFYIFNHELKLAYRGQFDDARPGNGIDVTGESLSHALDCLLNGSENKQTQKPSLGCNIKWKDNV